MRRRQLICDLVIVTQHVTVAVTVDYEKTEHSCRGPSLNEKSWCDLEFPATEVGIGTIHVTGVRRCDRVSMASFATKK